MAQLMNRVKLITKTIVPQQKMGVFTRFQHSHDLHLCQYNFDALVSGSDSIVENMGVYRL